ncbi:low temperature requirement protein A [Micromonospora sp. NPDC049051]|uniref:low temperature requirement protein A n=1 Tax=Micromonospora sp. NPDC049051 TaxID=3364264 RepID=UPI0037103D8F
MAAWHGRRRRRGEGAHVGLLREANGGQQATFVELFFDLVMVFALTRLVAQAVPGFDNDEFAPRWANVGRTLLLFAPLLWLWTTTAYLTARFAPRWPGTQLVVVGSALGLLFMGAAVPDAFTVGGLAFAVPLVAVQFGRLAGLVLFLDSHALRRQYARAMVWYAVSSVFWIVGRFASGGNRVAWWTAAVAVDLGAARLGWPVPGLGRERTLTWRYGGQHLADRFPQFLLISLGETILAVGIEYSAGPRRGYQTAALLVAFFTTVLLWRIYFFRVGDLLADAFERSRDPAGWGRRVGFAHGVMVLGVVATAIGNYLVHHHHTDFTFPSWRVMIIGGPVLFLLGRSRLEYLVFDRVSRRRVIGIAALLATGQLLSDTPPLALAATAATILLIIAVLDQLQALRRPPEHAKPAF